MTLKGDQSVNAGRFYKSSQQLRPGSATNHARSIDENQVLRRTLY